MFARCGDPSGSQVVRYGDRQPDQAWVNVAVNEWVTKPTEQR
jgi:hypothetical protein